MRVGILGFGELGRDAAGKLAAIGFDVAGWSASAKRAPGIACFHGADGLEATARAHRHSRLPAAADRGDARHPQRRLFAKLPRDGRLGGPVLINAGRGGLQVEADIVAALDRRR